MQRANNANISKMQLLRKRFEIQSTSSHRRKMCTALKGLFNSSKMFMKKKRHTWANKAQNSQVSAKGEVKYYEN